MTAGTAEKTLRSEDELRELAAAGARELGAELDADGHVPAHGEADHTAARLAHLTGLPVVSVFYRLCHDGVHHPVPHEDCWAAYQWVRSGGHGIATDPARVAVGGASAGACLAATVGLAFQRIQFRK